MCACGHSGTYRKREGDGWENGRHYVLYAIHCERCHARLSGGLKVYE